MKRECKEDSSGIYIECTYDYQDWCSGRYPLQFPQQQHGPENPSIVGVALPDYVSAAGLNEKTWREVIIIPKDDFEQIRQHQNREFEKVVDELFQNLKNYFIQRIKNWRSIGYREEVIQEKVVSEQEYIDKLLEDITMIDSIYNLVQYDQIFDSYQEHRYEFIGVWQEIKQGHVSTLSIKPNAKNIANAFCHFRSLTKYKDFLFSYVARDHKEKRILITQIRIALYYYYNSLQGGEIISKDNCSIIANQYGYSLPNSGKSLLDEFYKVCKNERKKGRNAEKNIAEILSVLEKGKGYQQAKRDLADIKGGHKN